MNKCIRFRAGGVSVHNKFSCYIIRNKFATTGNNNAEWIDPAHGVAHPNPEVVIYAKSGIHDVMGGFPAGDTNGPEAKT